jgi:hypothetical protein
VTTGLAMTTILTSLSTQTSKVSYPKSIDIWYSICLVYVYGAMLEYCCVNVLTRREQSIARERSKHPQKDDQPEPEVSSKPDTSPILCGSVSSWVLWRRWSTGITTRDALRCLVDTASSRRPRASGRND